MEQRNSFYSFSMALLVYLWNKEIIFILSQCSTWSHAFIVLTRSTRLDNIANYTLIYDNQKHSSLVEAKGWNHVGHFHEMDVDRFDASKYPELSSAPWFTVRVNKGDCIYLPLKLVVE